MSDSGKKPRYRFFLEADWIDEKAATARIEETKLSHQIKHVLRLKEGEEASLLDNRGNIFTAELSGLGRTYIDFRLNEKEARPRPTIEIVSYLPLIKAHRFEWALEKLTELGVSRIAPFHSERCMVKAKGGDENRGKRWQAICREASEQCERTYLPEIDEPRTLQQALEDADPALGRGETFWLRERSEAPDMVSTLYNRFSSEAQGSQPPRLAILAGPEGGFSEKEQAQISAKNLSAVSLGRQILRSETASILAAGLVCAIAFEKD